MRTKIAVAFALVLLALLPAVGMAVGLELELDRDYAEVYLNDGSTMYHDFEVASAYVGLDKAEKIEWSLDGKNWWPIRITPGSDIHYGLTHEYEKVTAKLRYNTHDDYEKDDNYCQLKVFVALRNGISKEPITETVTIYARMKDNPGDVCKLELDVVFMKVGYNDLPGVIWLPSEWNPKYEWKKAVGEDWIVDVPYSENQDFYKGYMVSELKVLVGDESAQIVDTKYYADGVPYRYTVRFSKPGIYKLAFDITLTDFPYLKQRSICRIEVVPADTVTPSPTPNAWPTPVPTRLEPGMYRVDSDTVYVKSRPHINMNTIGSIYTGCVVEVLETVTTDRNWARVSYDADSYKRVGYVETSCLKGPLTKLPNPTKVPGVTNSPFEYIEYVTPCEVTASSLNVREGKGEEYAIIDKLPRGTRVDVYWVAHGWATIVYTDAAGNLRNGSVNMSYLKELPAEGGQPSAAPSETVAPTPTVVPTPTPIPTPTEKPTPTESPVPTERPSGMPTQKPTEAPTEEPVEMLLCIVTASRLNVRAEPSSTGEIIDRLPRDTFVALLGIVDDWGYIAYEDSDGNIYDGFVSLDYLALVVPEETPAPTLAPTAVPTSTPKVTVRPTAAPGTTTMYVFGISSRLKMRAAPSTTADVVTYLRAGNRLECYEIVNGWAHAKYTDAVGHTYEGWVATSYLRGETPASTPESPTAEPSRTPEAPTAEPSSTPEVPAETPTAPASTTMRVSAGGSRLKLRASASTSAAVVTYMDDGSRVECYEIRNGWAHVKYVSGGRTYEGWALATYLITEGGATLPTDKPTTTPDPGATDEPDPSVSDTARVSTGGGRLNMRVSPAASARVVARLQNGTEVAVLEWGGEWTKCAYGGITGYCATAYLKR